MRRQAFTILETVLAASLAGVVVLGCLGAFFAMERSDRALSARFAEANDLARIQRTMQRAFTSLQLSERSIAPEEDPALTGEGADEGADPEGDPEATGGEGEEGEEGEEIEAEEEEAAEPAIMPRIALGPDNDPTLASMISRARYAAGGGGTSVATPQRLELVLSSVPIRPPSVQSSAWATALVGVEDVKAEQAAEAMAGEDVEQVSEVEEYDGVRGAFVLRPDDPTSRESRAREAKNDDRIGWTLWWQPLDGRSEPARVASGLAACHFQMFRERQMVSELVGSSADDLPTYIELEVETLSGLYANYLFEVVWTVDLFGEEEDGANGQNAGGDEAGQNGQGGPGGNGAGPGRGGGRDGAATDRPGRPKPQSPQGLRPGQQLEATPRDRGRPVPPPSPGGGRGGGGGR